MGKPLLRVFIVLAALAPATSRAWDTTEHIRFGHEIATPFEQRLFGGKGLPVIVAKDGGPRAFGHWVSAPDFGRGFSQFLNRKPLRGDLACAALWTDKGVTVNGQELEELIFAESTSDGASLLEQRAVIDCSNVWWNNNSHFGDFARRHYAAHHEIALRAARLYRATRQPACQKAAYTLEAWGQHYITDMTAAGHAWNPPGHYEGGDLKSASSLDLRLPMHNYLNKHGVKMAGELFDKGTFWGDSSYKRTPEEQSIPDLPDNLQNQLTVRMSRMSLGQVIAAAECGAPVDAEAVMVSRPDVPLDVRRFHVSNESMCSAFAYQLIFETQYWFPKGVIDYPIMQGVAQDCKNGDGVQLEGPPAGAELAAAFFGDEAWTGELDGQTDVSLEDLGCHADAPVVAIADGATDLCGNVLCQTPQRADGGCQDGLSLVGGCCVEPSDAEPNREVPLMRMWTEQSSSAVIDVVATSAAPGEASELLGWKDDLEGHAGDTEAWVPLAFNVPATLEGGKAIATEDCGKRASVTVYEALVMPPSRGTLGDQALELLVRGMDEGLRISVDGRFVGHLTQKDLVGGKTRFTLASSAIAPGTQNAYSVRLVHINDCEEVRPLEVTLALVDADKADGAAKATARGCQATPGMPAAAAWLWLLALGSAVLIRRRVQS